MLTCVDTERLITCQNCLRRHRLFRMSTKCNSGQNNKKTISSRKSIEGYLNSSSDNNESGAFVFNKRCNKMYWHQNKFSMCNSFTMRTSCDARALKFLTVLGTVFPNSPMTILPLGSLPILMSRYALLVTSVSESALTSATSALMEHTAKTNTIILPRTLKL